MADGKVVIDTEVDSSGAEKSVGKLSKGLTTALKGTAVAIGSTATAIGVLGTQSVKLYSEYEQLVGGVDTLFKESSKTVQKYASESFRTAGLSANEYMETVTSFSASMLQSLGGDTKKTAEYSNRAIIDMSDNANKMGTSMEMIQNAYQGFAKQNYTMLDNLKLGYGGTQKEMQRLLDDASKISGQKYDLSNFADITEAIHVIQTEMGITGTTSKEAASTIQGSVGMMKSAWENFLTGMADPNQDFDALLGNLIDSVVTVGENLIPRIQMMLPRLVEGLVALVNSLVPQIPSILQTLLPALFNGATSLLSSMLQIAPQLLQLALELIVQFAQGITQATPQAINSMIECVFSLIDSILDNLPLVLEAGLEMLFALGDGLIKAIPNVVDRLPEIIDSIISTLISLIPLIIDTGVELLTSLTENLPLIITSICNAIPMIVESIVSNIETLVPLIIDAGVQLFVALVKNLPVIIATVLLAVSEIFAAIVGSLIEAKPRLKEAGYKLLVGIVEKIGEACKWIGGKMKTVVTAMKEAITKKIKEFTTIGKQIVEGVWQGIKGMKDTITKNVKNFFGGIVDSAKEKLGIHSPSRVFEKTVGENIALGVIKGLKNKYKQVKLSAKQMASLIYESAKEKFDYYTKYNDMSLANEVAYWKKIVSQTKKGTQGYKDAMLEYKNAKSDLDNQVLKLDEDYASGVAKIKDDLIKNIQAITDEYEKSVESRKNAILNSMDIFKAFESTTENTSESLITNLEGQVDALNEWDAILDSLEGKGLSAAIIGDLQSMGVNQLADLRLLNEMTEEQLLQFASLYDQKNVIAKERAVQELAGMRQEAETEIQELIESANTELDKLEADYIKGLAELGVKSADKSKQIGLDIVNGLKDGIKSQQAELQSFLSSFFNSIMSSAKASLSVSAPQIANTVLAGNTNGVGASSTVNNNSQVVNVYQQVSTPDELARAVRLETRYA
jgi:phage-related protein